MIAANYRKFPEAMALQLVLLFGRCTWHTARPTQRAARAVRAARGELVKHTPQLVRWVKKAVPAWFKLAKRKAVELANQVREACAVFAWDMELENEEDDHFETDWDKRYPGTTQSKMEEPASGGFEFAMRMPGGIWTTARHRLGSSWWFKVEERRA